MPARDSATAPIMLVSNPNAGKTTLFNQITGLRHKTANYPGTTLDLRAGPIHVNGHTRMLYDMPGLYTLEGCAGEERVAVEAIAGCAGGVETPGAIILVLDATNLVRNLYLASQVLELGVPVVIALNMMDLAEHEGTYIDVETLEAHLGCTVVPIVARRGAGVDKLLAACGEALETGTRPELPRLLRQSAVRTDELRYKWAESVGASVVGQSRPARGRATERIDAVLLHPAGGLIAFFAVLFGMFYLIFSLANVPMNLVDGAFASLGAAVAGVMPEGPLESLLVDGIIAGVGGVLIFLPQICILFFCISILEDTGYLARAACVVDRVLRRVGLPGKAFVPMLSAHACAIPAIMASRVIEDRKDRLVTILVLPLMTCSARLPVYAMVTALLFPASPLKGALLFTAAYGLGLCAALSMAFVFRRTVVRSKPSPLVLELPSYKAPSVKTALFAAYDRAKLFVKKAGTVILAISIVLWWMMSYPKVDVTPAPEQILAMQAAGESVENWQAQQELAGSLAGRLGHAIEPVIAPLGFDWRIGVGVIASFAAREVVVSALSIIFGVGEVGAEGGSLLIDKLHAATYADGTPVFTTATCASLLVFYILAMQCLPTLAVTRREAGGWKWAGFQFAYMSCLAYVAALATYQGLSFIGLG
jgi:ferrous iron transport protein B